MNHGRAVQRALAPTCIAEPGPSGPARLLPRKVSTAVFRRKLSYRVAAPQVEARNCHSSFPVYLCTAPVSLLSGVKPLVFYRPDCDSSQGPQATLAHTPLHGKRWLK